MSKIKIAKAIKDIRLSANLTQAQLAKKVGKKQQTIASWESGQSQPDADTLFLICDICKVSIDDVYHAVRNKKERPAEAPLDKLDEKILDRLKAFPCPEIAKQHILSYLDLLENEISSFSDSLLTVEEAEELNKIIEETYPDQSTDFQKSAG